MKKTGIDFKAEGFCWEEIVTILEALDMMPGTTHHVDGPIVLPVLKEKLERLLPGLPRRYASKEE